MVYLMLKSRADGLVRRLYKLLCIWPRDRGQRVFRRHAVLSMCLAKRNIVDTAKGKPYPVYVLSGKGFTLIEVMVALTVFALAATMLMLSDGNSIRQTRYMQEKVLASQVADHHLNVIHAEQRWSDRSKQARIEEYAGLEWYVREQIIETHIPGFNQAQVEVFVGAEEPDAGAAPLSRLVSYIRKVDRGQK